MAEEISYNQQKIANKEKKKGEVIVTRKMEIYCDAEFKPLLYKWARIVRKSANLIMTSQYMVDNIAEMLYITDEVKAKIKNVIETPEKDGILTYSRRHIGYPIISKANNGELPSAMLSSLNDGLQATYGELSSDIYKGNISLPSYRNNIPIPFPVKSMRNFRLDPVDNRYKFNLGNDSNSIPFTIKLGRDRSRNDLFLERYFSGEYKLCGSSVKIETKLSNENKPQNKFYLLAVFNIPKKQPSVISDKVAYVHLDINQPMIVDFGNGRHLTIGSGEEFLHRRLAIKGALDRLKANLRYAKGGKGRGKKMANIERYEKAEVDYVTNRIHNYTRKLIDECVEKNCGKIVLVNQKSKEAEAKKDIEYLLRNWSYFGMKEKILYKAKMLNIIVEEVEIENGSPIGILSPRPPKKAIKKMENKAKKVVAAKA